MFATLNRFRLDRRHTAFLYGVGQTPQYGIAAARNDVQTAVGNPELEPNPILCDRLMAANRFAGVVALEFILASPAAFLQQTEIV